MDSPGSPFKIILADEVVRRFEIKYQSQLKPK
jgi:hypothetical protein